MTKALPYALCTLLLLLLAACSGPEEDVAASPTAPVATAPGTSADDAAAGPASADAQAARTPEGPEPVEGTHYVEIADAQPFLPADGKIEVVEVFGYTCPGCASIEPLIAQWKQRQPDDVRVTLVAAPFGGFWMPYAKAYFAAEALGLADSTHKAVFDAIHRERRLPVQGVSNEALADFYAEHGADPREFARTMESFAVSGQMRRARQFVERTGTDSTPTLVVNGRYRVTGGQDYQDMLRITDHLVERERQAAGAATGTDADAGSDAADAGQAAEDPAAEPVP